MSWNIIWKERGWTNSPRKVPLIIRSPFPTKPSIYFTRTVKDILTNFGLEVDPNDQLYPHSDQIGHTRLATQSDKLYTSKMLVYAKSNFRLWNVTMTRFLWCKQWQEHAHHVLRRNTNVNRHTSPGVYGNLRFPCLISPPFFMRQMWEARFQNIPFVYLSLIMTLPVRKVNQLGIEIMTRDLAWTYLCMCVCVCVCEIVSEFVARWTNDAARGFGGSNA